MYPRERTFLPPEQDILYRIPEVEAITGKKRQTIYRDIRAGTFPKPVKLSSQSVAWRKSDLDRWMASLLTSDNKTPAIPFVQRNRRG